MGGSREGLWQLASANKNTSGAGQKPAEISKGSTETVLVAKQLGSSAELSLTTSVPPAVWLTLVTPAFLPCS